jgi:hypothetical protein
MAGEHLNAFYAYYDHENSCGGRGGVGKSYWNEADASWQPAVALCGEGLRLLRASCNWPGSARPAAWTSQTAQPETPGRDGRRPSPLRGSLDGSR